MPGYYQSRPRRSMFSDLPPTPPGSGSEFGYSNMQYVPESYLPQHNMPHVQQDAYDYQHSYMPSAAGPTSSTYSYAQNNYQPANSLPPMQTSYYEPMAPILPPLRMHEQNQTYQRDNSRSYHADHSTLVSRDQQQQSQQQIQQVQQSQQAPKEEKSSGGVSAKLDYDMERMTDFVTEATQSMYAYHMSHIPLADIDVTRSFRHGAMHPGFRKWIHQVLSATRLPSATILLSLHYLNDRVEQHPQTVSRNDENHFYRLLAVSLILGSKFLDDNTFINRSWSDVTSIKVTELNRLEMKWLHLINYQLHVDPAAGLNRWIDAWKQFDGEYAAKQQRARLSPLNTNLRHHASSQELRFSPYSAPLSANSSRSYATTSARSTQFSSPYSTSDAWSGTATRATLDDYYKRSTAYPSPLELEAARQASEERARQSAYAYSQANQAAYYATTSPYASAWDQSTWGAAHRYDCSCTACAYQQHYRSYPMPSTYHSQTVVG